MYEIRLQIHVTRKVLLNRLVGMTWNSLQSFGLPSPDHVFTGACEAIQSNYSFFNIASEWFSFLCFFILFRIEHVDLLSLEGIDGFVQIVLSHVDASAKHAKHAEAQRGVSRSWIGVPYVFADGCVALSSLRERALDGSPSRSSTSSSFHDQVDPKEKYILTGVEASMRSFVLERAECLYQLLSDRLLLSQIIVLLETLAKGCSRSWVFLIYYEIHLQEEPCFFV